MATSSSTLHHHASPRPRLQRRNPLPQTLSTTVNVRTNKTSRSRISHSSSSPSSSRKTGDRRWRFKASAAFDDLHEAEEEEVVSNVDGDGSGLGTEALDDDPQMVRVCDRLMEVFMVDKPRAADWRRLLAFSKEWSNIRRCFFRRCRERADAEEDLGLKQELLRLGRKLKEVDDDVQRHDELLEEIKATPSDISEIVAKCRKDFTQDFFEHLHNVTESYHESPTEQNALVELGNTCLAAVRAYDISSESTDALDAAELKFNDISNSPTLDIACKKIDNLAKKHQLDSALMLMLTKAWSAAKDSNLMEDEVKDILFHLYMTARGNLQQLVPKEIRILKFLLTIEDPEERMSALNDAFTRGDALEGRSDGDSLYTKPEDLFNWIRTVLDSYRFSREGSLIKEARELMDPSVIHRLEILQKVIKDKFM